MIPSTTSLLAHLPIISQYRRRRALIDAEAISLLRSAVDSEAAYQTARKLMRLARERGDRTTETMFAKAAVRIASVTGRAIGKGISPRYAMPTHVIEGERIVASRRSGQEN